MHTTEARCLVKSWGILSGSTIKVPGRFNTFPKETGKAYSKRQLFLSNKMPREITRPSFYLFYYTPSLSFLLCNFFLFLCDPSIVQIIPDKSESALYLCNVLVLFAVMTHNENITKFLDIYYTNAQGKPLF